MMDRFTRCIGILSVGVSLAMIPASTVAQDRPAGWEREAGPTATGFTVFHATHGMNLPSAETIGGGELQFEIAHRFESAISTDDTFFGLDGGARYRIGLAAGVTDGIMAGIMRSNLTDNVALWAKASLASLDLDAIRLRVGATGGYAWNTEVFEPDTETGQFHVAGILDVGIGDRVALGVVPTWIDNPDVLRNGEGSLTAVGLKGQVYLTDLLSVLAEWTITDGIEDFQEDPAGLGIQLETGGHFFTIVVTNSLRLNPAQHPVGAARPFEADELRLGFNITRLIVF